MKKNLWFLLPFLLIGCATVRNEEVVSPEEVVVENEIIFPWTTISVKAGEEIYAPINCGLVFYDKTQFVYDNWDYSVPEEFGEKVFVATFPYTFYFDGKKEDVFYELIIKGIDLDEKVANLPIFSEIEIGSVIGTASEDNPKIMVRTVIPNDPNLIIDSSFIPAEVGNYTYFDASIFMSSTPKFLTFKPVTSKKDMIEFWDYPESLEDIANASISKEDGKSHIVNCPVFNIMIKTQLDKYPEKITTEDSTDILLRQKYYSFCETELTTVFDGLDFHLYFYPGFRDYLLNEYVLGEDICLYLTFFFSKDGALHFYARDFSIESPEEIYTRLLKNIEEKKESL